MDVFGSHPAAHTLFSRSLALSLPSAKGACPVRLELGYLDVAADAERLLLGREEGVGHLLRGGLDLLLYLLLGDTLQYEHGRTTHAHAGRTRTGHRRRPDDGK